LPSFRRINSIEANTFTSDLNSIAVDDTGLAGDVGHRRRHGQEED